MTSAQICRDVKKRFLKNVMPKILCCIDKWLKMACQFLSDNGCELIHPTIVLQFMLAGKVC